MKDDYKGREAAFTTIEDTTTPPPRFIDWYSLRTPLLLTLLVLFSFIEDNAWFKCGGVDYTYIILNIFRNRSIFLYFLKRKSKKEAKIQKKNKNKILG